MGSCLRRLFGLPDPMPEVYTSNDFDRWNEESIAATFIRLITRSNFPYDKNMLSLKEFNDEYDLLENYITWYTNTNAKVNSYSYNFTSESMSYFLSLIRYDPDDRETLAAKWKSVMYKF